ncbi:Yip1 domain-containing protein [Thermoanaerobacter uzonensis DSM 18761]|uniref:Yip1 domain-containing protein n=1 Tax=Thermoanaerobacter uzonensis DSM 18761 TaxID=1123369 RepID=A0A1M4ZIZ4_9THEO|nr:Yip1 family protein [Thermoanaerobacter uzonensis]SHF17772.1 Yip1 domain-containing protein [Thermoanaerobacter uzonensis DSM 18761]
MNFLERLYGVFFQPVETIKEIVRKKPIWQAVVVIIATGLLTVTSNYSFTMSSTNFFTSSQGMPDFGRLRSLFIIMAVFGSVFIAPLTYFVYAAVYHFLAEILEGKMYANVEDNVSFTQIEEKNLQVEQKTNEEKEEVVIGTAKGLYSAIGFAKLPMIFMVVVNLFARLLNPKAGLIFMYLFLAIFTVWVIVLEIIAIRENYKMSTGNAVFVFFLPYIVLILLFIIMMIFMGATFISLFSEVLKNVPMQ